MCVLVNLVLTAEYFWSHQSNVRIPLYVQSHTGCAIIHEGIPGIDIEIAVLFF